MPLLQTWKINNLGRAAIWKIEEPEAFFLEHTGLESGIKNDKRRVEHLAGRFLLKHIQHDFPIHDIAPDVHEKPRIPEDEWFFSISHSYPYVAVAIDPVCEAGIDIQTPNAKIGSIRHKFLSGEEQEMLRHDMELFTLAWCAKEAAYKWNGRRQVEFIEELPITFLQGNDSLVIYSKLKQRPQMIFVESIRNEAFICAYVDRAQDWEIY